MEKEIARNFIPMVNDLEFYNDLQKYVLYRIEVLKKDLETAELTRVDKIQGQIKELRHLALLREEVLAKAQ